MGIDDGDELIMLFSLSPDVGSTLRPEAAGKWFLGPPKKK